MTAMYLAWVSLNAPLRIRDDVVIFTDDQIIVAELVAMDGNAVQLAKLNPPGKVTVARTAIDSIYPVICYEAARR
jgi:hypothetical protein